VRLVLLTVTGWPVVTDGLDGDLARLQQWPRREDGPVRVRAAGLRRSAWCGGCPGTTHRGRRRGYRTKASGRSWCGEFPGGRLAPAFSWSATFPPCRVRGHAPLGARRAPRALDEAAEITDTAKMRPADADDLFGEEGSTR
jgi:hypothetical protein